MTQCSPHPPAVPLWLMYCRYAMAEVDPEADPDPRVVARVRDVFEAALRAAGLHVQQACHDKQYVTMTAGVTSANQGMRGNVAGGGDLPAVPVV